MILSREQHYLDSLDPEYNINPIAGSRLGSVHSEESKALMKRPKSKATRALMSKAKSGVNHPKGSSIYQYARDGSLVNTFCSTRKAAEFFNWAHNTIARDIRNGELFQNQWILSTFKDIFTSSKGTSDDN